MHLMVALSIGGHVAARDALRTPLWQGECVEVGTWLLCFGAACSIWCILGLLASGVLGLTCAALGALGRAGCRRMQAHAAVAM